MKKLVIAVFTAISIALLIVKVASAQENKFITVVNPVRVAPYTAAVSENLAAQYKLTDGLGIPATWLVTYDVLEDESAVNVLLNFDKSHEIGLFLEVTKGLAADSGISYPEGAWHFSNIVFLSGYIQDERVKLIDTLFEKYYEIFGTYPKSVGSWWTDSFSLKYIHEKYGVIANLTVADQFSTDRYQVWGQYWAMPYYPSKFHSAIPASSTENRLPVVMLQWAPRDPISGYYSSLYSTQDYYTGEVDGDISYFKKLMSLYLNEAGEFGQVTIGLEGDLTPDVYSGLYKTWLETAKEFVDSGETRTITMSGFSDWYRANYPILSPAHLIYAKDLLGKNREIIWYQNPKYRVAILSDNKVNEIKIFDLRIYLEGFYEPYYHWPNRSFDLAINVPSVYDEVSNEQSVLVLRNDSFKNISRESGEVVVELSSRKKINLHDDKPEIVNEDGSVVQLIKPVNLDAYSFRDLTPEASHLVKSKKLLLGLVLVMIIIVYLLYRLRSKKILVFILSIVVALGVYLYFNNTEEYLVSQAEMDVLRKLSEEKGKAVLVYDKECLQCEWYGDVKPAVFANKRKYVEKLSGHKVVLNKAFFEEKDLEKAKSAFTKLKIDYIYLVSYGYYIEKLPVSPGDINVEKVYANANAELWRVKND